MAKIMFLSFYNALALGARLLSAILREQGHAAEIVLCKDGKGMALTTDPTADMEGLYGDSRFDLCLQNWKLHCYNYSVSIIQPEEYDLLEVCLDKIRPDIVGLTSMSYFVAGGKETLRKLKRRFPAILFVAGGYGPTFDPDSFLEVCDYVFKAECEKAFPEFVDRFAAGRDLRQTPNIVYQDGGKTIHNRLAPALTDLDRLPFPDFMTGNIHYIDDNTLQREDPIKEQYYIMVGRGCPGTCTYCSTSVVHALYKSEGQSLPGRRLRGLDNLFAELARAKALGYPHIFFEDSYLLAPKAFMYELFARYKKEITLPFFAYLHYTQIVQDPGILDAAVDAGLQHANCAVQHAGEKYAADCFGRNVKSADIRAVARMLIDRYIPFHYDFITDNPLETEEDFEDQLRSIPEYPFSPSFTHLGIARLRCFPGTALAHRVNASRTHNPFADVSWLYKALLITSRFLLNDGQFAMIRRDAFLKAHPTHFLAMIKQMWMQSFIETNEPVMLTDVETMQSVYELWTLRFLNGEILVWGTSGRYQMMKGLFKRNRIAGLIDNDPAKRGARMDGLEVHGPEFILQHRDKPVFICSTFKKEIVQQIRKAFGTDILIP